MTRGSGKNSPFWIALLVVMLGLSIGCPAIGSGTALSQCNQYAQDPELSGAGVRFADIQIEKALDACAAAVAEAPGDAQLLYLYGRVLERNGDVSAAFRSYRWASDLGNPGAQYALSRLISRGEPTDADSVDARALVQAAAQQGYGPALKVLLSGESESGSGVKESDLPPEGKLKDPLDAILTAIGSDPEALRVWIADELGTEVYSGLLRGALGTLLARAGNAVDKSELLATLLRKRQPSTTLRFAHCELEGTEADNLLKAAATHRRLRSPTVLELAEELAKQETDSEIQPVFEGLAALRRSSVAEARGQAAIIESIAASNDLSLAPPHAEVDRLRMAVKDHIWVQLRQGEEWRDLDPTIASTASRRARCEPDRFFDEVPSQFIQNVRFRLFLEEFEGGEISHRELMSEQMPAADLIAGGFAFTHIQPWDFGGAEPDGATLQGQRQYTPLLLLPGRRITGESFLLRRPKSAPKGIRGFSAGFGGALDRVGDFLETPSDDNEPSDPSPIGPKAVGEVLEIVLRDPVVGEIRVQHRIFDRLGETERSNGGEVGRPLHPLEEAFEEYRDLTGVLQGTFLTGVGIQPGMQALPEEGAVDLETLVRAMGALQQSWDELRRGLFDAAAEGGSGRYLGQGLGLSLLDWRPGEDSATTLTMNVAHDPVAPLDAGEKNDAALWAAASVLGERVLLDFDAFDAILRGDELLSGRQFVDVAQVFRSARKEGISFRVLTPDERSSVEALKIPSVARRMLDERLDARLLAMVPEQAILVGGEPRTGWWLIDPATGMIRDEMDNGTHGELTEYPINTGKSLRTRPVWRKFRSIVCKAVSGGAMVVLMVFPASSDVGKVVKGFAKGMTASQVAEEARRKARQAQKVAKGSGSCGPP